MLTWSRAKSDTKMVAYHSVQIAYGNFEVLRSISRHAYNQQWNITLQRELPAEVVVSAAYVGSKGTRLCLNREVNPAVSIPGVKAGPGALRVPSGRSPAANPSGSPFALPGMLKTVQRCPPIVPTQDCSPRF